MQTLEQRHSPAQDAVMRVNGRMAEIGFEPGAAVVSRLLVHSRQIGCLWGKGGMIVSEMRRVTGASIQIFPREQVAKYGVPSDEVVQVPLKHTAFIARLFVSRPGKIEPYQEKWMNLGCCFLFCFKFFFSFFADGSGQL